MHTAAPMYLTSPLLAHVPHAFTTRVGGCSTGIFSSLNFGNPGDLPALERDPAHNIEHNQQRMLDALGCSDRSWLRVHQIHGCDIHDASLHPTLPAREQADAIISDDARRVLSVRVADCAPVLLATVNGALVAAVHAGWRGMAQCIVQQTILAMRQRSQSPIVAAIGPCIGPNHFEVGPEVCTAAYGSVRSPKAIEHCVRPSRQSGRFLLDLSGVLVQQLAESGVENIHPLQRCTVSEPELFFSHRGQHGKTGRMAGLIGAN